MTIKNVANELLDINDKSRKEDIINFLRNNPGCSKEELVRGVKNTVSKKTVIKILKELEREEIYLNNIKLYDDLFKSEDKKK